MEAAPSAFTEATREQVLGSFHNIPWDDFVRAKQFLNEQEVNLLRKTEEQSLEYILGDQAEAAELVYVLMKVLRNITSEATAQQYALTRIEDILSGTSDLDPTPAAVMHGSQHTKLFQDANGQIDPTPFLNVMREGDSYCQRAASTSLARLLIAFDAPMDNFISWLCEQLTNSRNNNLAMRAAVGALTILLRKAEARLLFGQHGGIGYLTKLLKMQGTGANAQLLYALTFCLWTLSFCEEVRSTFMEQGTIPVLCEQVTAAPREKVVRVSLATLRNLCEGEADVYNTAIIGCGLPKTLKNMRERQWADPDVADDVEAVYGALMSNFRELSTFERWAAEVNSKQLKWGLVHQEKFWRENAKELEANDFALLKALIDLLGSDENDVVSVACYDLGEWVRFYPNGKSIVKHLGAKDLVMAKIDDADPEVQRHALQCMSKIMVQQWEFMR